MEVSYNYQAHCLIIPYPAQGHINPMLQFSKRLQHEGVKITLATTKFFFKKLQKVSNYSSSISVETFSDGFDEGHDEKEVDSELYLNTFQRVGTNTLKDLLLTLQNSGFKVDCIVYDSFIPWILDVSKDLGIYGAVFFTQSCAVDNIYYHVYQGFLKIPLVVEDDDLVRVPGLPVLAPSDLPSFVTDYGSYPGLLRLFVDVFMNIENADWIFLNTFYELEDQVIDWMSKIMPVKTIGPAIPSLYLDKRIQDDNEYGMSMFHPMIDACMTWLNERSKNSVVYVSFGSLASLNPKQMEELAWGLRNSNKHFLWVVRQTEQEKLPKGFLDDDQDQENKKGLVVSWCPQLQVLAHESVGCFMTHCGWNSTLEALSLGVPMIAMPQWTDQATNAKFVMDVWKMGIKAKDQLDEKNGMMVVKRDEIEKCVRQIMDGEGGIMFRKNADKWKELARNAVDEGGSSDKNIKEFVNKLASLI